MIDLGASNHMIGAYSGAPISHLNDSGNEEIITANGDEFVLLEQMIFIYQRLLL